MIRRESPLLQIVFYSILIRYLFTESWNREKV